jgi:hypothetical protein
MVHVTAVHGGRLATFVFADEAAAAEARALLDQVVTKTVVIRTRDGRAPEKRRFSYS